MAKEIPNDEISAHLGRSSPLPLVYNPAFRFIRRHSGCDTAGVFDVLDFNVSKSACGNPSSLRRGDKVDFTGDGSAPRHPLETQPEARFAS